MSIRIGNTIILRVEGPAECELCKKVAELRPYGPGGKCVCFDCAKKTPEIMRNNCRVQLLGEPGEIM